MTSVRWGIVSTADIGMEKVTPAIQRADNCDVVAIASRSIERATAAAAQLEIPRAYGSYEELLADEEIDAVYVPLPNDLHAEWAMKAAAAGKHVLCEKPLAMSAAQAEEMATFCDNAGVKLAEAFMYRHHPTWVEAVRLVRSGMIGDLQAVRLAATVTVIAGSVEGHFGDVGARRVTRPDRANQRRPRAIDHRTEIRVGRGRITGGGRSGRRGYLRRRLAGTD